MMPAKPSAHASRADDRRVCSAFAGRCLRGWVPSIEAGLTRAHGALWALRKGMDIPMGVDRRSDSIEFWFDPSCPFTWQTSVWLRDVAGRQGLAVRWRLMSLAVLNEGRSLPAERLELLRQAGLALRVLAAADEYGGSEAVGDLYRELGRARHEYNTPYGPELFRPAVAQAGLPDHVAAAAGEERFDAAVRASHAAAQRRIGSEAGSPILAIAGGRGFFGPVVVPPPIGEEADTLFEAVRLLNSVQSFSELKTARAAL
jgi:2-hydroxychromene-2-carboxylate isomerase